MVTIYTQENCQPCKMTKRSFNNLHISYKEISMDQNPEVRETLKAQGFMSAPVVIPEEGEGWAGFSPTKIKSLATV